ncbi:TonB-dependent receptor [bacterium]|nr:TonB-dependent receptor [bacterium]
MDSLALSVQKKILLPLISLLLLINLSIVSGQEQAKAKDLFSLSLKELMNVEITTAGKKPEKVSEIPASVVVINRKDIERYGYQSLREIIENVPGFYMIDDYFWIGGYNFGVRGFYSTGVFNDVVILVDGVSQKEDYYDSYNLSKINIPVQAIDRIEIVRGPMSVVYGSGAFFGAINIVTNLHTSGKNKPDYTASAMSGSNQMQKLFLHMSGKSKDISFAANGSIYRDHRSGARIDQMAPYPFPDFWGITDRNAVVRQRHKSQYFNLMATCRDVTINISHTTSTQNVVDGAPALLDGDLSQIGSTNISLSYSGKITNKLSFMGRVSSFFYSQINEYDMFSQYGSSLDNTYGYSSQNTRSWEGEANFFFHPNKNIDITAGLFTHVTHYLQTIINLPIVNYDNILYALPTDKNIITRSAWAQVTARLIPNLKTVAGLRIEKLNNYVLSITDFHDITNPRYKTLVFNSAKASLIPRIAFIFTPSPSYAIKLMYGKAIKQPSYGQNNEAFKMMLFRGAPYSQLYPAEVQTLELNFISNVTSFLRSNLSIFRNKLNNLINRENFYNENNELEWRISNSGKMETAGIELCLRLSPVSIWDISTSITLQHTSNKKNPVTNRAPGYAPKVLAYIKSGLALSRGAYLSFTGRYIGKMRTSWDTVSQSRIGNAIDPYFILDSNFHFSPGFMKNNFISCHFYNILNRTIRYPATGNSKWATFGTIGMGRTIFITLGHNW